MSHFSISTRVLLLTFLLCFLAAPLRAQVQTGTPPFGSFAGGPDIINLANLNSHLTIPIVNKPGRGMPFVYNVTYDTSIWNPVTSGSTKSWQPTQYFGWTGAASLGYLTEKTISVSCFTWDTSTGVPVRMLTGSQTTENQWVYHDPFGLTHAFLGQLVLITGTGCLGTETDSFSASSFDGSGYTLYVNDPTFGTEVVGSNGQAVTLGSLINTDNGPTVTTDPNGNKITVNSSGVFTDTLGTNILTIANTTPSTTTPETFTYTAFDGTSQVYKVNYAQYTVKTNFGCTGVTEYGPTATDLVSEIDLPDIATNPSDKYTIVYEITPGDTHSPHYVTGRVQKITLPSGGSFEYDYASPNDGINCTDGTALNLTRKISDGVNVSTWQFNRAAGLSGTWNTTQADPLGNETVITFNSTAQETNRKIYQGSHTLNVVLRTINTTWAANNTPAGQTVILEDGATQSQVQTDYDGFGNLDAQREYDWGSGAPGALVRTTTNTYVTSSAYTAENLVSLLTQTTVADSAGTIKSKTVIAYDTGTPTSVSGAAQHDDVNFGTGFTTRGNPTSITTFPDPSNPATAVTKNFTYDTLGNQLTAQLNCCQQKTFSFSATTQYAYPDSIVSGSAGGTQLTVSATYNLATGLMATSTDANGKVTSYSYDIFGRTLSITRPDGAQSTTSYNDANLKVTQTNPIQGTAVQKQIVALDGLLRPLTTTLQDASGTVYSVVQTQYDSMGRAYKTSNPYTASPSYWTTTQFDPLGRVTSTTVPDGSQSTISYALQCATSTDPVGKQRKSCSDGLGRMTQLYEPDVTSGNALTQQTSYSYTVLDALAQVTQGAQTRTYNYDGLGRLTSNTTPEAGTVQFQYNAFSLLTQRTDARGVITTYGYDTLNRLQSVSYNVGTTGVPATASVSYAYDAGGSVANALGRLTSMTDGTGSEAYSYDILGNVTGLSKVIGAATYPIGYQYNLAGELTQITYPSGRQVQQSFDAVGRLSSVASGATNYATGFAYNTAQQVTGFNYGNGVAAAMAYSPDRLQLTSLSYTKGATTLFSLSYGYGSAGSNNGQIASITDNVDSGRSVTYGYDALYRVTSAVTSGSTGYVKWGLNWSYDRYGNRLSQSSTFDTPPTNSVTVNAANNQITGTGYAYDASGNMTQDGANTLVYDAENRALSATNGGASGNYTYDCHSLRVKKISGSTTTVYIFSGGKVLAEYDNGAAPASPTREYIYSGSQMIAKIDASGTKYYHQDHLSNRVVTDATGTAVAQMGHYPFGESWYNATSDKLLFTTYERDSESGNDYAMMRFHVNRLARFSSPDLLNGSTSDPQSLNRYTYTLNDPGNLFDPSGMGPIVPVLGHSSDSILDCGFLQLHGTSETGYYYLALFCNGGGPSGSGGDGTRNGGGGQRGRTKPVDPFANLKFCLKALYGVDLRVFIPSAPGQNGNFIGANSNGLISVENDVGSYSTFALSLIGVDPHGAAGQTNRANPNINFTANDLSPREMYPVIQIHELGHSLDLITTKKTSEKSAERLEDCVNGNAH